MPDSDSIPWLIGAGIVIFHILGVLHMIHALMTVRTAQGTIAWMVSLFAAPWIAVPLYWVVRRSQAPATCGRGAMTMPSFKIAEDMHKRLRSYEIKPDDAFGRAAEHLGGLPFTKGNELTLLIDGEETFESIFKSIHSAKKYLLVNFFIVKNDRVGTRFKDALLISRAHRLRR